ncbi:MAG: hypothetical protein P1U56_22125 [Saprospiraceae bacterium]|nr:hypothetical protein [Saprospiraceae bacterium]
MSTSDHPQFNAETHIDMWKHYDSLRQSKNGYYLTTNSILVVIIGLLYDKLDELIFLVSILGILVCVSWFLLLVRNSEYISYHRKKASNDEKELWKPKSKHISSKYFDRVPVLAFLLFWISVLLVVIFY